MKKLLFFLIGFLIPASIYSIAYSSTDCKIDTQFTTSVFPSITVPTKRIQLGKYSSQAECLAVVNAHTASYVPGGYAIGVATSFSQITDGCQVAGYFQRSYLADSSQQVSIAYYFTVPTDIDCVICNNDSDEDGIPDECDIYPEDPTPYKVTIFTYQTDDNTNSGDKIYQQMHTDRGDSYDLGDADPNKTTYMQVLPVWTDPPLVCGTEELTRDTEKTVINVQDYPTGVISGEPTSTPDPAFKPGKESDGTETGDAALQDIIDNTGKTATNTEKLGGYIKDLNEAVKNMNRNISIQTGIAVTGTGTGTGTTPVPGDGDGLTAEEIADAIDAKWGDASGDKTALENVDPGLSDYDGTITEGVDYDQPGALKDNPLIQDFLSQSPLTALFTASGFETSGASCSISFLLNGTTHRLSLCEFSSGFTAFGNILLAFCGIIGLLHLISGRSI